MIQTITPQDFHVHRNEFLLIDVRERAEYAVERIEGSQLIPLGELSVSRLPRKDLPLVCHCRFGRRSAAACEKLLKEDPFLMVYSLKGGLEAWKALGEPTQTSS